MARRAVRIKFGNARLDAALAALADDLDYLLNLGVTPPLRLADTPAGPRISYEGGSGFPAVITGTVSAGLYTFDQVDPDTGGTWVTAINGVSGQAYEWNGNTSVPTGTYVAVAYFGAVDEYRFQRGAC